MIFKKVNFFIIGQPKCGTTALFNYFKKHNEVYLPEQKQLYHFAVDHNDYRKTKIDLDTEYYQNYYNYNLETYIGRFDFTKNTKIFADITPDYFYSKEAPGKIFNYNPNAKIILILREPLSFLKSFHNQLLQSGREQEKDFYKAISYQKIRENKNFKNDDKTVPIFFQYDKLVKYTDFIEAYYKLFNNNFKVILYEDFKKNNQQVLCDICDFLNIERFSSFKKIDANVSLTGKNKLTTIKRLKIFRFFSSLIPWKIKYWFKEKIDSIVYTKYNANNNPLFDDDFRKKIKNDILKLNDYSTNNNIFLTKYNNLLKKWGYA